MRISEVADQLGVTPSTVRYYERIGLVPDPPRTPSGYRSYDDEATARLPVRHPRQAHRAHARADRRGAPDLDGVNCAATHDEITRLIEVKKTEVQERIRELQRFAEQLDEVRAALLEDAPPPRRASPTSRVVSPRSGDATVTSIVEMPTRRSKTGRVLDLT